MSALSYLRSLADRFLRRDSLVAELDEELRAHVALRADDLVRAGLERKTAERQARVEFGGHARFAEETREAVAGKEVEVLIADFRLASRSIRRDPTFALTVILTFGLAIAGTSATYALVDAVLYRPLPFAEPERVYSIAEIDPNTGSPAATIPAAAYVALREAHALDAATSFSPPTRATVVGRSGARAMRVMTATSDVFRVTGLPLAAGRSYTAADAATDAPVALLAYDTWQREFNGEQGVVGRTLEVDGRPVTVIGILGKRFWLPGFSRIAAPDMLMPERVPASPGPRDRAFVIARVRSSVQISAARAEVQSLARRSVEPTAGQAPIAVGLVSVRDLVAANLSTILLALLAAVGLVLVIACVNVGNMMLARGRSRRSELAVRIAIGASRTRIVRLMATESVVLALFGGALALGLTRVTIAAGVSSLPAAFRRVPAPIFDFRLAAIGFGVTIVSGLLVSIIPALRLTRADLLPSITGGDVVEPRSRLAGIAGGRGLLIGIEVALALVLLTGAGMLAKTIVRLKRIDVGFDPARLVVIQPLLPTNRDRDPAAAINRLVTLRRRLSESQRVDGAAGADLIPFAGFVALYPVHIDGGGRVLIDLRRVSTGYFRLVGMRLVRGALFPDNGGPATQAVVNEAFTRAYGAGSSAIGRTIAIDRGATFTVSGVVSDVREGSIDKPASPTVYLAVDDPTYPRAAYQSLLVSTALSPDEMKRLAERVERELDPSVPITARALDDFLWQPFAASRFYSVVLGGFALLALLLAAVGLAGVIAESVSGKTKEIGIRLALGARRTRVVRDIAGPYLIVVILGLAAGCAGTWYSTQVLASLLYDMAPRDVPTMAASTMTMLAVGVLSSVLPAYRAAKVDPMLTLRR
jgi:putative ABC transport system permease protein